jgi:glycine/serine hydroxymethyltransferase
MEPIVALIDEVIQNHKDEEIIASVGERVHQMMAHRPLFVD